MKVFEFLFTIAAVCAWGHIVQETAKLGMLLHAEIGLAVLTYIALRGT